MINLKGKLMFVDTSNGLSGKLFMTESELQKLDEYVEKNNKNEVSMKEYTDKDGVVSFGINVKSQFKFPIWTKDKLEVNKDEYNKFDGAEVIVRIKTKDIPFIRGKTQKCCACYINGMVILKDGVEYRGTQFEEMFDEEQVEF